MTVAAPTEPQILAEERGVAETTLDLMLPPALLYFRGHFPDYPVLPGVVQLHWAIRYARERWALGEAPARTLQVKFRNVIRPGERLHLVLRHDAERSRLAFEYRDANGVRSSGQVGFA
jgi:3-hydroxymyristoyl/3-hydroxydecanoyl-(acyl carrier protein) dehydratase